MFSTGSRGQTRAEQNEFVSWRMMTLTARCQFKVSVFLLFALLFFVNVAVELIIDSMTNMFSEMLGRSKELDIEDQDPASLVGTFKRYK